MVSVAPVFAVPARRGLSNLLLKEAAWEAALARWNDTLVVLQSGHHDVSVPFAAASRAAPLQTYRAGVGRLAAMAARVTAANPSVRFVWRQTTQQLLLRGEGGVGCCATGASCNVSGFPGTHPVVIDALNSAARAAFGAAGAHVWEEPATLTRSGPAEAFQDGMHHDICGRGANRFGTSTRAATCAKARLDGVHERKGFGPSSNGWSPVWNLTTADWARGTPRSWGALGGLSEAITDTFFTSVLNCSACAGAPKRAVAGSAHGS